MDQNFNNKGFSVTTENRSSNLLAELKNESGIPKEMTSCHTAKIDGYFIEGHVPASDIKRLITDRPDALGLAVPAMPYGSPGRWFYSLLLRRITANILLSLDTAYLSSSQ